jgi:hypothetical protein
MSITTVIADTIVSMMMMITTIHILATIPIVTTTIMGTADTQDTIGGIPALSLSHRISASDFS